RTAWPSRWWPVRWRAACRRRSRDRWAPAGAEVRGEGARRQACQCGGMRERATMPALPGLSGSRCAVGPASTMRCRPHDGRNWLGRSDACCLRTLVRLLDLEVDLLALFESAVSGGVDGRVMDEDIAATLIRGDEAVALFGVEP